MNDSGKFTEVTFLNVQGSCSNVNSSSLSSNTVRPPQFIHTADSAIGCNTWKYQLDFKNFSFNHWFQLGYSTRKQFVIPHTKQSWFINSLQELSATEVLTWSHTGGYNQELAAQHTCVYHHPSFFSPAGNFVLAQFEDFLDKAPRGLLQVHSSECQNTLAPSGSCCSALRAVLGRHSKSHHSVNKENLHVFVHGKHDRSVTNLLHSAQKLRGTLEHRIICSGKPWMLNSVPLLHSADLCCSKPTEINCSLSIQILSLSMEFFSLSTSSETVNY